MTTAEQRDTALAQANRVRASHYQIRNEVKAGDLTVAEVLYLHSEEVETMAIGKLIRAQDRWGKQRASRLLNLLNISDNRRIGLLTDRQVSLLAGLTATIKRSELEGWERVSGDCPVHAAQLAEVGEGLLDGFLAMCEAGQRVIDNERSSDE